MRSVTHCPNCHTQFFVTEVQLNQHQGQVRCGQCMHVFDARAQFIAVDAATEITLDVAGTPNEISPAPAADATPAENSNAASADNQFILIESTLEDKPYNFENEADTAKSKSRKAKARSSLAPLLLLTLILTAVLQNTYFLRNQIAIYYPASKPYLTQACQYLACSIELPKKIEFIVIDDSDMEEDTNHVGLIHLSSTIINQAGFNQTYPNLEVTLTDAEDQPKLRRIFKPHEYLPPHTDLSLGIAAGESLKIKLAMTTQDVAVAGYRVFVTY